MRARVGCLGLLVLGAVGCATRQPLLNAPAVSMSLKALPSEAGAVALGPVVAEFCSGDEPIVSRDHDVGLIDEVVAKAERQSGASYIADARFFTRGNCVMLEGTAMRTGAPTASR